MELTSVEVSPGVTLSVRHWPASGAVPFLLVHGLSSNAMLWDGVARALVAQGFPAYAVDLRSHGGSDAPDDGYDTATAAEDLATVITRLGLGRPIVAGQSWGGNVVVRLAARHPDLVSALALVDGGWIDLAAQYPDWATAEQALRPPDIDGHPAGEIRAYLRGRHPGWSAEAVEATLANLRVDEAGRVTRRLAIPRHMRIARSVWEDPPWSDYPHIRVPVLLIPATPADGGGEGMSTVEKVAAALARARIRPYPGGDHDLHAQYPDQIAADLLALAAEA